MNETEFSNSRYSRFVKLPTIGKEGMKKIREAKATVVGVGGLGSVTAVLLTALGIGYVRLIDRDIVELTNLQRQMLYRIKDINKPKVIAAKAFLEELNPDVEIEIIQANITNENTDIATKSVDFVVDAMDKFTPRLALNKACLKEDIPFLFGAVSGMSGNAMTVTRGNTCLECLYANVDDNLLPTAAEIGIHPSIIQIIGNIQIAEATRIMIKQQPLLENRLLFCDINNFEFEHINVKQRTDCSCTQYNK